MSIEIEQDNECGPTVTLPGPAPRFPVFTIYRDNDSGDGGVDLSADEALVIGEAMIEWARSQGATK